MSNSNSKIKTTKKEKELEIALELVRAERDYYKSIVLATLKYMSESTEK